MLTTAPFLSDIAPIVDTCTFCESYREREKLELLLADLPDVVAENMKIFSSILKKVTTDIRTEKDCSVVDRKVTTLRQVLISMFDDFSVFLQDKPQLLQRLAAFLQPELDLMQAVLIYCEHPHQGVRLLNRMSL